MKLKLLSVDCSLFTANYALYMEKMTTFAQSKLVENLRAQNWIPTTLNVMKIEVDRLKIRNEQEYSPTVERLTNQLQSQLNRIVEQQGEMVIYENNKEKYERAQKRLAHLKKFVEIVADGMMNAECVWILMQLDIERVKKRNDFDTKLDENRMEVQNCNRRNVSSMEIVPWTILTLFCIHTGNYEYDRDVDIQ